MMAAPEPPRNLENPKGALKFVKQREAIKKNTQSHQITINKKKLNRSKHS